MCLHVCKYINHQPAQMDGERMMPQFLATSSIEFCSICKPLLAQFILSYIYSQFHVSLPNRQLLHKFTRPKYFVHTPADKLELGIVLLIWLKIILCRRLRQRSLKFATRIRWPNLYGKVAQCCCISFYSLLLKDSKARDPIFTS